MASLPICSSFESTKFLKKRKKYEECVNQVTQFKSRFYADAQNLLNECQFLAQDQKRLAQAKLAKRTTSRMRELNDKKSRTVSVSLNSLVS